MKNGIGVLIRQYRMERNLSQEDLCKGICVVSYLSKIEQGKVIPGEDIARQLFLGMGIDFVLDEVLLRDGEKRLRKYFEARSFGEQTAEFARAIREKGERFENSPLHVSYHLFLAYDAVESRDAEELRRQAEILEPMAHCMDAECRVLYDSLVYHLDCTMEKKVDALRRAKGYHDSCLPEYLLAEVYNEAGDYHQAIEMSNHAFSRAVQEGNAWIMMNCALLTGSCYANLYNIDLMLQYYRQAAALARKVDRSSLLLINYNIGATLVGNKRYEEAIDYLLSADDETLAGTTHQLLTWHKLVLAYGELGRKENARLYIEKAFELLGARKFSPMHEKLIRLVQYRYGEGGAESEAYNTLLMDIYENISQEFAFGFKQFHGNLLIEALVQRRKYKEALAVAMEIGAFPEK